MTHWKMETDERNTKCDGYTVDGPRNIRGSFGYRFVVDAKGYPICIVLDTKNDDKTCKSRCRAIAAAPKMAEVLAELLQVYDGVPMTGIEAARRADKARSVLAKVREE